jgi:hypothetical protein
MNENRRAALAAASRIIAARAGKDSVYSTPGAYEVTSLATELLVWLEK